EVSVCGALPPFSEALSGKLVTAYAADPRIRALCERPPGEILGGSFDVGQLSEELPRAGALLMTTQGLYAGHSAQYQDVYFPGRGSQKRIPLRKLGLTKGATASMMSRLTDQLATELLSRSRPTGVVSDEYGSGGSKRQRRIEAGVSLLGLSRTIIHPDISR